MMAERKHTQVLAWNSPFDMVCKLESEKERMQGAKTLRELVEHTMNFALTAYHMIDWVWAALERKPADARDQFERDSWTAAIGYRPKDKSALVAWAKDRCPELEYCRQLANASKHLSCKLKTGAAAAEFEIAATAQWEQRQQEAPFTSILDQHRAENWRLIVVDGGTEVDLIEMLQSRVYEFWDNLSYDIYIGV